MRLAPAIWLVLILAAIAPAQADDQPTITQTFKARTGQDLTVKERDKPLSLSPGDVTVLAGAQDGDKVEMIVDKLDNPQKVTKITKVSRPVEEQYRALAILVGLVIVIGIAMIAARGNLKCFVLGLDHRYSNSKCQLVAWFGAMMAIYLASVIARVWIWGLDAIGGVGIPEHLLELTGLSGLTFAGAKAITTQKVQNALADAPKKAEAANQAVAQATAAAAAAKAAGAAGLPKELAEVHAMSAEAAMIVAKSSAEQAAAATVPKRAGTPNILSDLVTNDDGQADIGDFQMIFIALVAVITFVLSGFNFLGAIAKGPMMLPDIDTTLLSTFGIGQGAYLIKKLAAPVGKG